MVAVRRANALRWARPFASEPAETRCLSEAALTAAGLPAAALFGRRPQAFRRVESVSSRGLEVLGPRGPAWLPCQLAPAAVEGQWLRFERLPSRQVRVGVDLAATLSGESRLLDLYQHLGAGR